MAVNSFTNGQQKSMRAYLLLSKHSNHKNTKQSILIDVLSEGQNQFLEGDLKRKVTVFSLPLKTSFLRKYKLQKDILL